LVDGITTHTVTTRFSFGSFLIIAAVSGAAPAAALAALVWTAILAFDFSFSIYTATDSNSATGSGRTDAKSRLAVSSAILRTVAGYPWGIGEKRLPHPGRARLLKVAGLTISTTITGARSASSPKERRAGKRNAVRALSDPLAKIFLDPFLLAAETPC
jgi:hypothetical protein